MTYRSWPRSETLCKIGDAFNRYYPSNQSFGEPYYVEMLEFQRTESLLYNSRFFDVKKRRFDQIETYNYARMLNWIRTWTDVFEQTEYDHRGFEQEVAQIINKAGGVVEVPMTTYLTIARKKAEIGQIRFVSVEEMENVIDNDEYIMNPNIIEYYFLNSGAQILYLCEDKKRLKGCITPMDVIRYHSGQQRFLFNRKYVYLETKDLKTARAIFLNKRSIHEIPVVENGCFVGCFLDDGFTRSTSAIKEMRSHILKYYDNNEASLADLFTSLSFSEQKSLLSTCFDEGVLEMYSSLVKLNDR